MGSVDQGIDGHLARRNLAALAEERGDHAEATRLWQVVFVECPNDREARNHLGGILTTEDTELYGRKHT